MLSRRRVVVLLLLSSLLLISVDRIGNPVTDAARSGFARVLQPFDAAAEVISEPIARAWYGVTNYDDLQRENEALRDQIELQKGIEIEHRLAIDQFLQIVKLIQITSAGDFDVSPARVVGEAPSNFQNTVEISIGTNRGVLPGMPVINGAGLVGKVSKVNPTTSIVQLVTDPLYNMGAEVLSSSADDPVVPESSTSTPITTPSGQPVGGDTTTSTSSTTTTVPTPGSVPDGASTTTSAPSDSTSTTTTTIEVEVRRETGTIEGQGGDEPLLLRFIDDTSAFTGVEVGDAVGTSGGIDSLSPQGIPIGTISRIQPSTGNRSPVVEVEINADLDQLNFVSVVLFVPNQTASG